MGLWQFMPATGRMYQLNVSLDADDRKDPLAATEAAAKYLKSLYRMFDDWEVALAAYNCGPGNVRKAIRRAGGKKGFWEIYPYLPRETRGYVPQFQAMMYVMRHKELHGLVLDDPAYPIAVTKVKPGMPVDFEQLATVTGVKAADIMQLNPAYHNGFLPESHQHKGIQLPAAAVAESMDWEALAETLQPDTERMMALRAIYNPNIRMVAGGGPAYEIKYRVQSGDVLGKIAQRHGTTVANIKMWNNLNSNTIRVGQQLTLYTAAPAASSAGGALVAQSTVSITEKGGKKLYTVQPGDSLWLISKKVEGLSVEQIKKLNNLQNNQIKPGQQLIIG
uniref:LysM peptidoglycan-binding domain-containing protein n=1 Tax=Nitritalea halalkaliphila TaxID=590849 RepID=UPI0002E8AC5A|nr:LysM peptidoglycan-binding domain-containing protein [Nitritalea halalkaliphila]